MVGFSTCGSLWGCEDFFWGGLTWGNFAGGGVGYGEGCGIIGLWVVGEGNVIVFPTSGVLWVCEDFLWGMFQLVGFCGFVEFIYSFIFLCGGKEVIRVSRV